jgi:aminoglycoside phosphotransferase (APT) family kinase protein
VTTCGALRPLIDAAGSTALLVRAGLQVQQAVPTYIRHKPGTGTIVAHRIDLGHGDTTWGYAHWFADPARAEEIWRKAIALHPKPSPAGPGVVRLDPHTVCRLFPNDGALRRLRWWVEPRKLKRSLGSCAEPGRRVSARGTRVQVLRYKPQRRVVLRVDLATGTRRRRLLVRYSARSDRGALSRFARHLHRHGVAVPTPIGQFEGGHVTVDSFVDGTALCSAALAGAAIDAGEIAAAISRFHGSPPLEAKRRSPFTDLSSARAGLRTLTSLHPASADVARSIAGALEHTMPEPDDSAVLLHGDLHGDNMLVSPDGVLFVDLERISLGPAAADLGQLLGHATAVESHRAATSASLLDLALAAVDDYRRSGGSVDPGALAWYTAIALTEQAVLSVRRLEPDWATRSIELLEAASAAAPTRAQSAS